MNDLPWWAKPAGSTADVNQELHNMPVESGSVFPLTTYADNTTRFNPQAGVLGSLINAFTAPSRAYNGQIPPNQMVPEGMNMAGAIALGSLPVARPRGALGVGGHAAPRNSIDFIKLFHGTTDEGASSILSDGKVIGPAYFTPRRDIAESYGNNVLDLYVPRSDLKVDFDLPAGKLLSVDAANDYALAGGKDARGWTIDDWINSGQSVGVDNDVFIKTNRHKNNLLAANPATAALSGLFGIYAGQQPSPPFSMVPYARSNPIY